MSQLSESAGREVDASTAIKFFRVTKTTDLDRNGIKPLGRAKRRKDGTPGGVNQYGWKLKLSSSSITCRRVLGVSSQPVSNHRLPRYFKREVCTLSTPAILRGRMASNSSSTGASMRNLFHRNSCRKLESK